MTRRAYPKYSIENNKVIVDCLGVQREYLWRGNGFRKVIGLGV